MNGALSSSTASLPLGASRPHRIFIAPPLSFHLLTRGPCSLELVVWLVPSLIGGAVAVSLVGVLLGPMYPMVMNHAGRVLPTRLLTGSIGWIAGFGQAGSAFLPFLTGALASKTGIKSLQPL